MFFDYRNLRIYYEVFNNKIDKTPILFLHGWGLDSNAFNIFKNSLIENANCVFVDFPPFGKSSKLKESFNLEDYYSLIIHLLKKLKIKEINIVAHSFGGRIALLIASKKEITVKKMLLTGCAGIKRKELKIRFKVFLYKFKKALCKLNLYNIEKLNKYGSNDYKNLNPIMKQTFNNIVNFDERTILKNIKSETLFVWGKLDKETPFYFTKIFKKHIKNSEVITFDNLGHFAYLERPKEFLLILKSFFEI